MSDVLVLGPDTHDIVASLRERDVSVERLDGAPIGADLAAAGVDEASVLLLTSAGHASSIPVAHERNEAILVVLYTGDRLPPFASAQADLAIDPALVDVDDLLDVVVDRVNQPDSASSSAR